MTAPTLPVGFDYALALLRIREHMTYEQIAEACGLPSKAHVAHIINGRIPRHPQGEAIWVIYRELFGDKPPMHPEKAAGVVKVTLVRRRNRVLAV